MWIVKGTTTSGKPVEYKVPTAKDTDKAFVLAMAFQEHGTKNAEDPLTASAEVAWTSDNVSPLSTPIILSDRKNFSVDKRISKGVWERHSQRAYRSLEAAEEALESAASEQPTEKFRIVLSETITSVVSVSRNALDMAAEKPDEVKAPAPEQAKAPEPEKAPAAPAGKPARKAA